MPRHVRDLRSAVPPETAPTTAQTFMSDDEDRPLLPARRGSGEESSDSKEEVDHPTLRRSGQEKRCPDHWAWIFYGNWIYLLRCWERLVG